MCKNMESEYSKFVTECTHKLDNDPPTLVNGRKTLFAEGPIDALGLDVTLQLELEAYAAVEAEKSNPRKPNALVAKRDYLQEAFLGIDEDLLWKFNNFMSYIVVVFSFITYCS